jgi:hypothetical protein
MVLRLLKACQETPVDAPRGVSAPPDAENKLRCDECRVELFERRVYCSECDGEGQDPETLLDLVATHPPRSNNKKDRSTLPDWLRVGCRVLVNLTVSGNSNDKPPRVVGAAHLPAMVLKTGHGFFTVHLEGAHEQVVKRKAAIEPHPDGPQLALGYRVKVRAEGGGGGEPQILLAQLRKCVYCCECFARAHRAHNKRSATYLDGRLDLAKHFEAHKKEILQRSAVRKDDLCVWNPRAPLVGGDDVPEPSEDEERRLPRLIATPSVEAGQRAMHLAQVMGPSPYHYPNAATAGTSPQGTKLLAPMPQEELLDRRLRTTRKRVFSDMLDPTRNVRVPESSRAPAPPQQKRSRSGSGQNHASSQTLHHHLDMVEEEPAFQYMEQHLAQAGLPQMGMHAALQGSSFFVGRKSLSILLEADAVVKAHAELLDAGKPEEIRGLWAKARRDVPLKKVWRFINFEGGQNAGPDAQESKRRAIDALAESAAAAEPAPEVA